jgi:hypothetical protein
LKISDIGRLETRIALWVTLTEVINFLNIVMSPCKKNIVCYLICLNSNKKYKKSPDSRTRTKNKNPVIFSTLVIKVTSFVYKIFTKKSRGSNLIITIYSAIRKIF